MLPAMSQADLETARGMLDAWNRGDFDGLMAATHPDVEWVSSIVAEVEGSETPFVGRAGLRRFWDDWHSLWNAQIEADEIRDLGDTIVVMARLTTTGGASGVEIERAIGYVFRFENGVVRRVRAYLSPAEALKAAAGTAE